MSRYMSFAQMQALKSGPRVNIFVGPQDDPYIGVEGAYANVLIHYSGLAKEKLSAYGVTRFNVPDAEKEVIAWIYRYMLAGEKDDKWDDLLPSQLVSIYAHAMWLDYQGLANKTMDRLRYLLYNYGIQDIKDVQIICAWIPALRDPLAKAIATELVYSVSTSDVSFMEEVSNINELGYMINHHVTLILEALIKKAVWYYNEPGPRRYQAMLDHTVFKPAADKAPKKVKTCFKCGKIGHLAHYCKACNNCGVKGHFARDCQGKTETTNGQLQTNGVAQTNGAAEPSNNNHVPRVNGNVKGAKACFICGKVGHLARHCTVQWVDGDPLAVNGNVQNTNGGPVPSKTDKLVKDITHLAKDVSALPKARSARPVIMCYNCGKANHLARNCRHAPREETQQEQSSTNIKFVDAEGQVNGAPKARREAPIGGPNKYFRRVTNNNQDKENTYALPVSNGEGITTYPAELRRGQKTRLGLEV